MNCVNIGGTLSVDRLDEDAKRHISDDTYDLLQLVNGGEIWNDLQFLIPYARKIRKLRISGIFNNFAGLDKLTELSHVNLEDCEPRPVLDLSPLSKLQSCKMGWSPRIIGSAFFSIPELQHVSLFKYAAQDCMEIGLADKLRSLILRHGSLGSLIGISGCEPLEELRLIKMKGLVLLEEIAKCRALRILEIEKGAAFIDISASLEKCSSLMEVLLDGDFEISCLSWLNANTKMTRFRSDAVVLDVDWTCIFEAPKLFEISFKHRPGMLQTDDEIKKIANHSGKQVQWIEHGGSRRAPWIEIHFNKK